MILFGLCKWEGVKTGNIMFLGRLQCLHVLLLMYVGSNQQGCYVEEEKFVQIIPVYTSKCLIIIIMNYYEHFTNSLGYIMNSNMPKD